MTTAIFCAMFTLNQGAIDLFRVKFLSNGRAPIYTQVIRTSQQLFHNAQSVGENQHATRVFCDFVEDNLNGFQFIHHNNEMFQEKLAVMIFDGNLNLGVNLSTISNEFFKRNIVWALIGVTTPDFKTWDSYHTFARRTGGAYMFIANAPHTLLQVISSVVTGQNTLRQAFGPNDLAMANRNDDMNEHDQVTDGDADLPFDHDLSY